MAVHPLFMLGACFGLTPLMPLLGTDRLARAADDGVCAERRTPTHSRKGIPSVQERRDTAPLPVFSVAIPRSAD